MTGTSAFGDAVAAAGCPSCLRRAWLLARLAGHLEVVRHRTGELLALDDDALVAAVSGGEESAVRTDLEAFDAEAYAARAAAAGVGLICRCRAEYPPGLRELDAPPHVLHVAGSCRRFLELSGETCVAVVGARRASPYALDVARALGRGLAAAGITVISGLARGVDAAAHDGALASGGRTVAVHAAAPERPYPLATLRVHRRVVAAGAAVSELGEGLESRRWMFPARNRIIAGLAAMTVVVAGCEGSGALVTARHAAELGRVLGAVPGQAGAPLSWGPHRLLRDGARLVEDARDVLDVLFAGGTPRPPSVERPLVDPRLQPLVDALADGFSAAEAFAAAGLVSEQGLAALAELELAGHVRRDAGGRFSVTH